MNTPNLPAARLLINDNNPAGARGMARYLRHAVDGLISRFGSHVTVFSPSARDYGPARFVRALHFKGSEQLGLHDRQAARLARQLAPNVIYNAWFTTLDAKAAQVIVVYDLIFERFPSYHSRLRVPLRDLRREREQSIRRSDGIIAISRSTANDILQFYPETDAGKITVIPLGVEPVFFEPAGPKPAGLPERPYLLYVGFRTGHKNFHRLLEALGRSGLAAQFDFVVVSSAPLTAGEAAAMRRADITSSVWMVPWLPDDALRDAYAGAAALVYPSEHEGFGLPIVEAMASGTVVAASDRSSMPEVGAGAALYFDPFDVDSMAAVIRRAVELPAEERARRVRLGRERAGHYTWDRCRFATAEYIGEWMGRSE